MSAHEVLILRLDAATLDDHAALEAALMDATARINSVFEELHAEDPDAHLPVALVLERPDLGVDGPLIPRSLEYTRRKSLDDFVAVVAASPACAGRSEAVADLLRRVSLLLEFVMTLELDFQVFVGAVDETEIEERAARQRRRVRATLHARRLRAQFVAVALVLLVVLSVPYVVDGLGTRSASSIRRGTELTAMEIEAALHADATSLPVRWFQLFPLPATAAEETARRTRETLGTWRAHRFVEEKVRRVPRPDSLRAWSAHLAAGTPPGRELFAGWRRAPGRARDTVRDAVRAAVLAHDLRVAAELERLVDGRALESTLDVTDPHEAAERLVATLVVPEDASPEIRALRVRAERRADLLDLDPSARAWAVRTDRWRETVEDAFAASTVEPDRLQEWLERASALDTGPDLPVLRARRSGLSALRRDLSRALDGLRAQRQGDSEGFASHMQELMRPGAGVHPVVQEWARRRLADARALSRSRASG